MRYLILIIALMGCGKTVTKRGASFPSNEASPLESSQLDRALIKIQTEFETIGVSVNLRSLPYSVTTLGGNRAGVCYKKGGRSIGIALDHSTLADHFHTNDYLNDLYRVLLHEIGHCFFNRDHESGLIKAHGHDLKIFIAQDRGEGYYTALMNTVMATDGWHLIPNILWPYYVKEIAGQDRINKWKEFDRYTYIQLVTQYSSRNLSESLEIIE